MLLGNVVMTRSVSDMGPKFLVKCLYTLAHYDAFTKDNDPHGEHDSCTFEVNGQKVWFKIEYYNHDMSGGSEDPAHPAVTVRMGTLCSLKIIEPLFGALLFGTQRAEVLNGTSRAAVRFSAKLTKEFSYGTRQP
jgi:hypothetical protein